MARARSRFPSFSFSSEVSMHALATLDRSNRSHHGTSATPTVVAVASPIRIVESRPRRGSLARSLDGRWTAVATGDEIWLEDARTKRHLALALPAGDELAVTTGRVWVVRDGQLSSISTANGDVRQHELAIGAGSGLTAVGAAVVLSGARGTCLVREDGAVIELSPAQLGARALGESRVLLIDPARAESGAGGGMIVEISGAPTAVRLATSAPILDACPLLDRGTCLLLLDRGGHQELAIMRVTGSVLVRIKVNRVSRIVGATRALRAALAIDDGRVVVYDLRERRVVSADRPGETACELVIDPDGTGITGVAWHAALPQLFVRRFS